MLVVFSEWYEIVRISERAWVNRELGKCENLGKSGEVWVCENSVCECDLWVNCVVCYLCVNVD